MVKYAFDETDLEKMRAVLGSSDWDYPLQSKSVNEQWSIIIGKIKQEVNMFVHHETYNNKEQGRRKPP